VPLAIPVALGLGIGVVLAASHGTPKTTISQAALDRSDHRQHHPRPAPSPSPTSSAAATGNCDLLVPRHPLTARGLATPYVLESTPGQACSEADTNVAAFVQATILDPATGQLSVYDPLVVTKGTAPAVAPVVPRLPRGAVVDILFGYNGSTLQLVSPGHRFSRRDYYGREGGDSLRQGNCVNGLGSSLFGQVAYCNGPAFFRAANAAIAAGKLAIPALGTGKDGKTCMSVRDFGMVDQDQSDNVTSQYLGLANGQTAQLSAANTASLAGQSPATLNNGSDNLLLNHFIDPALGCAPFTAPNLADPGARATSQALDELQAAAGQVAPVALVPLNDPMTEVNGALSTAKTNLYRAGVDQPAVDAGQTADSPAAYCTNAIGEQAARLQLDQSFLASAPAVDPAAATSLYTFLAQRLSTSFANLNCGDLLNAPDPIGLTTDANGVVTAATFVPLGQTPPTAPAPDPTATATTTPAGSASPSPTASATVTPAPSASPSPSGAATPPHRHRSS